MRFDWSDPARYARALVLAALLSAVVLAPAPSAADGWKAAPLYGADVRSVAFDPQDHQRVLAGTSSGQIYESRDSGANWKTLGGRVVLPGWVISDLHFDPHRPGRVWAGLWALWGVDGAVVMSDDGGRTWTERGIGLPSRQVYALALASDRPDELWAATRKGVWSSRDAGANWRPVTAQMADIGKVTSLLVDPHNPDILYAGTWRRAYRSDDRGATWRGIFTGMALDSEVFSLTPGNRGEGDLWASTCGWVYHGQRRGEQWQRHTNGLPERRTPSFEVLADGSLLAGTVAGVYRSTDRGASWRRTTPEIAVATIEAHPRRAGVVLVGSEGSGVWRSQDGGATFEPSATGMVSVRVTDVVAARSGLTLSVRYAEHNDGVHRWTRNRLESTGGGDRLPTVLDLAVDGELVVAATERGLWERRGKSWQRVRGVAEEPVEQVAAADGSVFARTAREVLRIEGGEIERITLAEPGTGLVWWAGALWFVEAERLWRWDAEGASPAEVPITVDSVQVFGDKLVVEGADGRMERSVTSGWNGLTVEAPRVLATADPELPMLGLWKDGSATLHDRLGRAVTRIRLPIPGRDVAASLLDRGRLHLATAGYGLLWSNVLVVEEESPGLLPRAAR